MDPFSLALGIGGLAAQLGGTYAKYQGSQAASAAQQQQIQLEQQAEDVKHQYQEMDYRRKSMEVARNVQKSQALATNNASTQGGLFGSGIAGGLAQISGYGNTNKRSLDLSNMFGNQMYGIQQQISQTKIAQSQAQSEMQLGSGLSSLGGSLIGAIGPLRQLTGSGGGNPTNVGSTTSWSADT